MALFELCPNKKKKDAEDFKTCYSQVKRLKYSVNRISSTFNRRDRKIEPKCAYNTEMYFFTKLTILRTLIQYYEL